MVADEHEMRAPSRQGKAKEKFWRKTLARFVTSGLSQVEFCKREGLNPSNLGWWKREIATRDAKSKKDQPMESQRPGRSERWPRFVRPKSRIAKVDQPSLLFGPQIEAETRLDDTIFSASSSLRNCPGEGMIRTGAEVPVLAA